MPVVTLRTATALGLIAVGLAANLLLVLLILGEGLAPARLSHGFGAALALGGGALLLAGLALLEPLPHRGGALRRPGASQAFSG
jgi:hypothetical protein